MARRKQTQESAAQTLDEIESLGDRLVEWVGANPILVLGSALGILLLAAAWGFTASSRDDAREKAAAALAKAQADYRQAMGATAGSIQIDEPANPETGRRVRTAAIEEFLNVGETYAGSTTGAIARLEAARLQQELGDDDAARATLEIALGEAREDDPVRAFLMTRAAAGHEAAGRWREAAEAYAAAAAIEAHPLRSEALADAARCYAQAGDAERALDAWTQLQTRAPEYRMQPYVEARLAELRLRAGGPTAAGAPSAD